MDNSFINFEFNIIPFKCRSENDYEKLCDSLKKSQIWDYKAVEAKYMLRFVTDNLNQSDDKDSQVIHYVLKKDAYNIVKIPVDAEVIDQDDPEITYPVRFLQTELFLFNTGIGVVVFEVQYAADDPMQISYAEYAFKKAHADAVRWNDAEGEHINSAMDLADVVIGNDAGSAAYSLFFFANANHERANVMSYVEQRSDLETDKAEELK